MDVQPARLTKADQVGSAIIGAGALIIGAFQVLILVYGVIHVFDTEPRRVYGMPLANATVPEFTAKSNAIVGAGYESVWLEIAGLPLGARWLLFLETALPALATLTISIAIAWLAIALLRGRPFSRALTNGIGTAAIAVLVGGLGAQIAAAVARESIVSFLDPRVITAGGGASGSHEGLASILNLSLAPIGWSFGLALVAVAFHIGTRLQRDTEGLV